MGGLCCKRRGPEVRKKKNKADRIDQNAHCSVIDNPAKINELYDMTKERIGEGSYATTLKAVNKSTGYDRAIKVCSKAKPRMIPVFKEEIRCMKRLDHPYIVRYYESFEDADFIYIVMTLCHGPEIFDILADKGHLSEPQTARLMSQIFRAITYMHAVGVCHRDLKAENYMLYDADVEIIENSIRIIDFGLACTFEIDEETGETEVLTQKVGTPYFVAPQVLCGHYNHMADVWSTGVLMFAMLSGYPPFYGQSVAEVLAKVRLGNYQFNQADWKGISEEAQDLIKGLLKINPRERLDTELALKHPWIQMHCPRSNELPLKNVISGSLRNYASANKLKKAALYIIAGNLTDEELRPMTESFHNLDVEGDGALGYEEIHNGLLRAGIKDIPVDLKTVFDELDVDGSGTIEFTEFLAATIDKRYITEETVWSAFRIFDNNGDGKISQTEMYRILNLRSDVGLENVTPVEVVQLMRSLSHDGDTYCDFYELFSMLRGEAVRPVGQDQRRQERQAAKAKRKEDKKTE